MFEERTNVFFFFSFFFPGYVTISQNDSWKNKSGRIQTERWKHPLVSERQQDKIPNGRRFPVSVSISYLHSFDARCQTSSLTFARLLDKICYRIFGYRCSKINSSLQNRAKIKKKNGIFIFNFHYFLLWKIFEHL